MRYLNSLFSPALPPSATASPMKVYLDIVMFVLIIVASYTLLFAESSLEYKEFMIVIMFGYLLYFLKYRLADYFVRTPRLLLRSLSELHPNGSINSLPSTLNNKQSMNQSVFLQEYNKREH